MDFGCPSVTRCAIKYNNNKNIVMDHKIFYKKTIYFKEKKLIHVNVRDGNN